MGLPPAVGSCVSSVSVGVIASNCCRRVSTVGAWKIGPLASGEGSFTTVSVVSGGGLSFAAGVVGSKLGVVVSASWLSGYSSVLLLVVAFAFGCGGGRNGQFSCGGGFGGLR